MDHQPLIRRAMPALGTPAAMVADIRRQLDMPGLCLVVVFTSAECDLDLLALELNAAFGAVPVIGCTTAGEIGPDGYGTGSVMALGLAAPDFAAAPVLLSDLATLDLHACGGAVRQALHAIRASAPHFKRDQMFAFTLIDGLSGCEETVVSALHGTMGEIPLCGGSAGDCLRFARTRVLHGGRWHDNAALFVLVATALPFHVFKTEHFTVDEQRAVVTAADLSRRVVTEINAEPAADEYARVVGLELETLTPMVFANHPMVVRVGGANFVRSIQKVNDDGSLTFFCAIDEGIVLRVARGIDLGENLAELFSRLRGELGEPALILGFDCILRGLEMDETGIRARVGRMMADNNVFGFATYGEQFQAMHVNQTFTGIAIGKRSGS
ncbi:MAG: FIST N-terminal domain-containing protein [Bacteroidota bacterium]